ncbi:MAG: hypothetical protein F4Y70_09610 [Chloroflexi bacterium]|nr:hypothetical protein [Chloroflexota bacterium]
MYSVNEILFPHYAIPALRNTRGEQWAQLVDELDGKPDASAEVLGLMSLMIDLNGCLSCETDSFRAMRGCAPCAKQALRRCKDSDEELLRAYQERVKMMRDNCLDAKQ